MHDQTISARIRAATPDEARHLSDLALRSKGYWGYTPEFLEACRAPLTLSAEYIMRAPVFVAEERDTNRIVGFYGFDLDQAEADLEYLFIDPAAIGHGYGKLLFEHAVETARRLGLPSFTIAADPFAETFYRAMGAQPIGEIRSEVDPSRLLPLLRMNIA